METIIQTVLWMIRGCREVYELVNLTTSSVRQ